MQKFNDGERLSGQERLGRLVEKAITFPFAKAEMRRERLFVALYELRRQDESNPQIPRLERQQRRAQMASLAVGLPTAGVVYIVLPLASAISVVVSDATTAVKGKLGK